MPSTKTLNQSPTIGAVDNNDLLWIWDISASELNKISRTTLLTTTDDFNSSYARLAGRSGGQTLIGGTAANDDLTLEGTSSATRTTSYVILQPNGGNVGIGTTSPGAKLEVSESLNEANAIYMRNSNTGLLASSGYAILVGSTVGEFIATNQNYNSSTNYGTEANTVQLINRSAGPLIFKTAGFLDTAEKMRITSGGNVGIGTTSPSRKLHVVGTILIDGDEGGIAGTIGLTDVNDATLNTGTGTVKLKGTTARDSAGFIKMYVGTTTVWVPYWTNIS